MLGDLVITHDSIAEGVHFLPFDPPVSVGWKLIAVNLSDLAAKGATPLAALLSLSIAGDGDWETAFIRGIAAACESYRLPLIGGDTIALPAGAPRVLGLTAIGRAGPQVPGRDGGQAGDALWLIGTVGDSAVGLAQLRADKRATGPLVDIYRRPVPLLAAGQALAPHAHAMLDVSDGLLIDALRLAEASGLSAVIELADVSLSEDLLAERGDDLDARLLASTGGDDYALLAALPPALDPSTLHLPSGTMIARIGSLDAGPADLRLTYRGAAIATPEHLGHEHHGHLAAPMADRP